MFDGFFPCQGGGGADQIFITLPKSYFVSDLNGSDSNTGTPYKPFKTLQKAAATIELLTPSPSNRFAIQTLDSETYSGDWTLPSYTTLFMQSARNLGKLIAKANSNIYIDTLQNSDNHAFETASTGGGQVHLFARKVLNGVSGYNAIFVPAGIIALYLDVNYLECSIDSTYGIVTNSNIANSIAGKIKNIIMTGTSIAAIGYNSSASSSLEIGSIIKQTGSSTKGIVITAGNLNVVANKIDCDTNYDISNGTLNLSVNDMLPNKRLQTGGIVNILNTSIQNDQCIQHYIHINANYSSGSNIIDFDDTKPQISEGTQFATFSYTPKTDHSDLTIRVNYKYSNDSDSGWGIGSIYIAGDSDPIFTMPNYEPTYTGIDNISGFYPVSLYDDTPLTISFRAGSNVGTMYINGIDTGRLFGGAIVSTIEIEERER